MVRFWVEYIGYNLEKIDEVPNKLKENVKNYIVSHKGVTK